MTTKDLAVVIPAFKARFLQRTLESIAAQTDTGFRVYVCDDCSPEPVQEITEGFADRIDLRYKRFPTNIGGRSLTKQWERSIEQTSEPWIWLFSDDDMMDPSCVEEFHNCLINSEGVVDVFRFNTTIVNECSSVMAINPPHPDREGAIAFLYFFLRGLRESVMQEHIFSREAYEREPRFLDLPLAWCADQAQVLRLAASSGFKTIPRARVWFRQSGLNISSSKERSRSVQKARAALLFAAWVLEFLEAGVFDEFPIRKDELGKLVQHWLNEHLKALHCFLGPKTMLSAARFGKAQWHEPIAVGILRSMGINGNTVAVNVRHRLRAAFAYADPSGPAGDARGSV